MIIAAFSDCFRAYSLVSDVTASKLLKPLGVYFGGEFWYIFRRIIADIYLCI